MLHKRLALTALVVVVAACTVADSESVRTAGMAAYMVDLRFGEGGYIQGIQRRSRHFDFQPQP